MYIPRFTINNQILKNIGVVEASREVIENAPIIPSYEKRFQDEAALRTVYYGTHLEGNDLTFSQARQVLEGETITARERDIEEIINYRNVVHYLDGLGKIERYNVPILTRLHALTTQKILPEGQVGKIRTSQVVIRDASSGAVSFRPPISVEVPFLLEDFFSWLNSEEGKENHPVLRAGISHYVLVAIHPFVEGNGRVARAFATLILFNEGYDIRKLFSLEEYFDRDAASYYEALQHVSSQSTDLDTRDLTPWLVYFTHGLSVELTRVKEQVKRLSVDVKIKNKMGKQVELTERQILLMEFLSGHSYLRRSDAKQILPMVSEDTILRELQDLVRKGIIKMEGTGRGARYRLRT